MIFEDGYGDFHCSLEIADFLLRLAYYVSSYSEVVMIMSRSLSSEAKI